MKHRINCVKCPRCGYVFTPKETDVHSCNLLPSNFKEYLRKALRSIDIHGDGLFSLPDVRRALEPLGLSQETLDAALLKLEKERFLFLKIANDPQGIDRSQAIFVPGRGLLFFLVLPQ